MNYNIHTIGCEEELSDCPQFPVDCYNWGGEYRPATTGRLGFLPGTGLLLEMECREENPVRQYTCDGDPVYMDSAMEAFFCFAPAEKPPCYLNFEMNANGAMLACYGRSRQNRMPFPESARQGLSCHARIDEHSWSIRLVVPASLIAFVYPEYTLAKGSSLTCNFYKIKESEGLTHFASFSPIASPAPDFHLPEFFAEAHII